MAKKIKKKYRPINIRTTPEEYDIIEKKAKKENRKVSAYCKIQLL